MIQNLIDVDTFQSLLSLCHLTLTTLRVTNTVSISKKDPLSYRMFNATLRKKFSALLEAGAAVVVWHYFPTDWPHLDTHDERFNMRVRNNADSGFTMKLVLHRETAIARTYSTRRCTESPVFPMDCDMSHVLHCHSHTK